MAKINDGANLEFLNPQRGELSPL
uniref:Uncharacterized protein n=1 Tax=Anguilla anguilla TaxID=7936 RepID=A0A0E9VFX8_ANGAN